MRSRIGFIRLKEWFPPDDAVATNMARLCILREDLFLESQAIRADELTPLDANGEDWRRLYFHRNIFRTLDNIRGAMHQLRKAMKKEGTLARIIHDFGEKRGHRGAELCYRSGANHLLRTESEGPRWRQTVYRN